MEEDLKIALVTTPNTPQLSEKNYSSRQFPTPEQHDESQNPDESFEILYKGSKFGSSNNTACDENIYLLSLRSTEESTTDTSIKSMDQQSLRTIFDKLFEPELNVQEFFIEFRSVPLRTPVKKTVKIENITPGQGFLNVEVTNFYHTEQERNLLNEMLIQMNMAKSTEWEDLVTGDGIVIKVGYETKKLNAFETIDFDIWVYANTWGYYLDEIVIDISQMLPFCASILVEVIGLPIEFPIAQNTICKEPTMRFGILPHGSENCSRKLKIVNTSVVPIWVSWHLFVSLDKTKKAFSLLFDMPTTENHDFSEESVKGELLLTDKYFGEPNTQHFEVRPLISYIEPRGFAYIEVIANVGSFDEENLYKKIEANLLGVIRLPMEFRYMPNLIMRPIGINLNLARVRITLEITLPELVIDAMPDKIEIVAYATDIMETQIFSHRRRFIIRNSNDCPAVVYLEIDKPFTILSTKTPNANILQFTHSITLNPRECMEVFIECVLTNEDVHKMVETLRNRNKDADVVDPNFEDNSLTITKLLSIYQRGTLHRIIPLELKIFYPIFKAIPGSIKFDVVYVGNIAKSTLTLRNLTASPIRYEVYKCNKTKKIIALPRVGIIPKLSEGGICMLNIFFSPSESRFYEEWIAITSNISHHYVIINITGLGTYDEKFCIPGLH